MITCASIGKLRHTRDGLRYSTRNAPEVLSKPLCWLYLHVPVVKLVHSADIECLCVLGPG